MLPCWTRSDGDQASPPPLVPHEHGTAVGLTGQLTDSLKVLFPKIDRIDGSGNRIHAAATTKNARRPASPLACSPLTCAPLLRWGGFFMCPLCVAHLPARKTSRLSRYVEPTRLDGRGASVPARLPVVSPRDISPENNGLLRLASRAEGGGGREATPVWGTSTGFRRKMLRDRAASEPHELIPISKTRRRLEEANPLLLSHSS